MYGINLMGFMPRHHRQREYPHLYASAKVGDESPKWLKTSPFPNKEDDILRASEVNSLGGSSIKLPRIPNSREERSSVVRLLFRTKSSCDQLV